MKKAIAEAENPSAIITLRVAMGPSDSVMGDPNTPSNGIVVLSRRFNPTGAFSQAL